MLTSTRVELPAPQCPVWCESTEANHQAWDDDLLATTKTCARTRSCEDSDGGRLLVTLERFAAVEDGKIIIHPPSLRLHSQGSIPLSSGAHLAEILAELTMCAAEKANAA